MFTDVLQDLLSQRATETLHARIYVDLRPLSNVGEGKKGENKETRERRRKKRQGKYNKMENTKQNENDRDDNHPLAYVS
jgi:hypothetical protein